MREIKFRAWDGQNKVMREVRSLHNLHSQVNIHADLCTTKNDPVSNNAVISSHYTDHNLNLVFMQYTGLKDKNGDADIYECDIIDSNGNKKGNTYEMDAEETDLVIQDFGGETWCSTYKKAVARGCRHS